MKEKRCPSCNEIKSLEEFGFRVNGIPRGWCKKCEVKNRVEKGYEHVRERFKIEAKYEVRNLLRRHKIKISNCCLCGSNGMIHMHHIDYALPLTFFPLCTKCHGMVHRNNQFADTNEQPTEEEVITSEDLMMKELYKGGKEDGGKSK